MTGRRLWIAVLAAATGATLLVRMTGRRAEHAPPSRRGRPRPPALVPARPDGDVPLVPTDRPAPAGRVLVDAFAALFGPAGLVADGDLRRLQEMEQALRALGAEAVPFVLEQLDQGHPSPGLRAALFEVLRALPGRAADERLVREARQGTDDTLRALAIEALGRRGSWDALEELARFDHRTPRRWGFPPRAAEDPSTIGMPDEVEVTPRMQAIAALAATAAPRAVAILVDLLASGNDEGTRVQAALALQFYRSDPRAQEALRAAAAFDPSPYVRLTALHAFEGSADPSLAPLLERIAALDRDLGVRLLARQILETLPS